MSPAGALGFGSCCCDVTRENSALQQISVNGKEALEKNSENAPIIHRAAPIELETVEEILQKSVGK